MSNTHRRKGHRQLWMAGVAALAVIVLGTVAWSFTTLGGGQTAHVATRVAASGPGTSSSSRVPPSTTTTTAPPPPVTVTSVKPANGATGVSGTGPIQVTFSAPIATDSPMPTLSPAVPGTWQPTSPTTLSFTPTVPFVPDAAVTVTVPGGTSGVAAADGAVLAKPVTDHFQVQPGSEMRLQEVLAQLAYLPLTWTPKGPALAPTDAAAQGKAAFAPPDGTFAWRHTGWPASLTSIWKGGASNLITKGAVMAFEADHGLTTDGIAGHQVWTALLHAVATNQANTGGYNYAVGSKTPPESLTIWHDGTQVFHNPANTGIAQAPTANGTFPVYERLRNQVMRGTNPDGSHYADPVQYVAYFNGGDAVHYLPRANYGSPASLGCIELPLAPAAAAWPYLSLGTLVTVTGP